MSRSHHLVLFTVSGTRYALKLANVERVVRAVAVMPLPGAPKEIMGVINLQGRIIPVLNTRLRFGHQDRPIRLSDRFLIARGDNYTVALVADEVDPVVEVPEEMVTETRDIVPGLGQVDQVAKIEDQMITVLTAKDILQGDQSDLLAAAIDSAKV